MQARAIPEILVSEIEIPASLPVVAAPVRFRSGLARFDYILLATMWLLTAPVFWLAGLPYAFNLAALTKTYLMFPLGAGMVAIILAVLGLPLQMTVLPFLGRIWKQKALLLVLAPAALLLCWVLGTTFGGIIFVESLAIAELSQRHEDRFGQKLLDLLVPGAYLYVGIMAIFAFNHAIVGIRYGGTEDYVFNRLDSQLFHASVSGIEHWGIQHIPLVIYRGWDFLYFSIWSRFGAGLILSIVLGTRKQGIQFVRNTLLCYSMALMIFAMAPAKGPYSICPLHAQGYPESLGSYKTQQVLASRIKKLYAHNLTDDVREVGVGDYYISFPSLHAALPLIAIWFLRRWKRVQLLAILGYCLLVPALVFLGWHYIIDIVGGWGVAALSIALTEWISKRVDRPPLAEAA